MNTASDTETGRIEESIPSSDEFKCKIEDLIPTDSYRLTDLEKNAFDYAFSDNNKEICNIAITGPYASGKSSILKSYLLKRENEGNPIKSMTISLAHFSGIQSEEEKNISDTAIESKIVNQLYYQLSEEEAENLSPHAARDLTKDDINRDIIDILILAASLVSWLYHEKIWGFTGENKFAKAFWLGLAVVFAGVAIHSLYRVLYGIVKAVLRKNIKHVKFGNYEAELEETNSSYFDLYMNEVIELFEKTDVALFIFEDIDRFNKSVIFERLRELNSLLNKHADHSVKFCYLTKDEIFESNDRMKFFDYIIPVVPVLSVSNAMEQIKCRLPLEWDNEEKDNIERWENLSLYIENMRELKNVCNDFKFYFEKISSNRVFSAYKLFAMMLYKTYFPEDFGRLQSNYGYLYRLLHLDNATLNNQSLAEYLRKEPRPLNELFENQMKDLSTYTEKIYKDQRLGMVRYFLSEGYISDDYLNYINQYTSSDGNPALDENLSSYEVSYIRNIKEHQNKIFYDELQNFNQILERLDSDDFSQSAAINPSMLEYLFTHKSEYSAYFRIAIRTASGHNEVLDDLTKRIGWEKDFLEYIKETTEHPSVSLIQQFYLAAYNKNLEYKNFDYTEIDLHGAILKNADLSGLNMNYAILKGANLEFAQLCNANLSGATLDYAILDSASFEGAMLVNTTIQRASMIGTIFRGANMRDANISYSNITNADFKSAITEGLIQNGTYSSED